MSVILCTGWSVARKQWSPPGGHDTLIVREICTGRYSSCVSCVVCLCVCVCFKDVFLSSSLSSCTAER